MGSSSTFQECALKYLNKVNNVILVDFVDSSICSVIGVFILFFVKISSTFRLIGFPVVKGNQSINSFWCAIINLNYFLYTKTIITIFYLTSTYNLL